MVEVSKLGLDGVCEIRVPRFDDARGFFSETWNAGKLAQAGIAVDFVQDNHSLSRERGVLRGLHFQKPPFAQDKLVRVLRGSIYDVAIDIRVGSPTFGKWVGLTVSAKEWNQILVPKGFAHGFVTLEPDTEVAYKVSAPYSQPHDRSIRFDDPDIAIDWPVAAQELILSDKDAAAPLLTDVETGFVYP
ncbi:dTDP-4-dehydrorhamnose 3,5-epimerase [Aminobacter sp. NyZ550]|jgi:dTDP-4-dehydrorhamnose 3,5-epimerase|uniref:dTDP-4-dehydrorhamnose 3,5-epimerase n=1 Tax=Aminobacter ciceronei TaxID=150723 RepID=A0ABR6C831_9HYPH|nr:MULTISPECIES: dTDP-4-dehydrorhamnose 3,5-epimerase [Aminobacter]MBA8907120.1 dTDP-4-dehydrorhamnose 3,5-epimerase [Aminobacter ciceronei]MBA9020622.1 dTDP-4-dehydrorhamnose 3,5-epimerase [Aminobacter ciceronei]MRX35275.1 dTDP-4-dehydrorhamnose 3,5-epimerase [Aminobacter sp. MDW-2]QNH35696.1 dTDP-4-dehydrorhamnose 3,5-epimerase [Aminobacter sp. MDW-2]WAX96375.1 dTDP-4-dehydrorhamnose 3,5-epimerase [Aminobacter sp. NyZ550]